MPHERGGRSPDGKNGSGYFAWWPGGLVATGVHTGWIVGAALCFVRMRLVGVRLVMTDVSTFCGHNP